jgi:hypothetical protein
MAIGVKVPHRMKPENEPPSVKMKVRSFSTKGLLLGLILLGLPFAEKGKKKQRRTKTTTMAIGFEAPHRMMKPDNKLPCVKMQIRSFLPKDDLPLSAFLKKTERTKNKKIWPLDLQCHIG